MLASLRSPLTDTTATFSDRTYRKPPAFADAAVSTFVSIIIVIPRRIVEVRTTVLRIAGAVVMARRVIPDDHLGEKDLQSAERRKARERR